MSRRLLPALLLCLLVPATPAAAADMANVLRKGGVNDGDTIIVRLGGRIEKVRFLGVQAFELTTYNNNDPSKWTGECHSVAAARFVLKTVKQAGYRVRLSSPAPATDVIGRLIRKVEVRLDGRWRDLAAMALSRGLVLWLHHVKDTALNERYSRLEQTAAAKQVGAFDAASCGAGPAQNATFALRIMSDPIGEDTINDEWVRLTNTGAGPVALGGWYLGNAGPKNERFRFPTGTTIVPGESFTVHAGSGPAGNGHFYRGLTHPIFENSTNGGGAGDAAYLVDPDGDVRAHAIYPCLLACTDANQGTLRITANPIRGPEYVVIKNVSDRTVSLYDYELRLPGAYAFGPSSILQPGETMQVWVKGDPRDDTRLERHVGYGGAYLKDSGGSVRVTTFDEIVLACDSWGSGSC